MKITRDYIIIKTIQAVSMSWIFSTYVMFLRSKGLSLYESNNVNSVYIVIILFFDPFTGSIADRFGQRKVYVVGLFWLLLGIFVYGFSSTKYHFYLCEAAVAIGYSFMSEALESWLRNRVGVSNAHSTISRSGMIGKLLSIPVAIIGGYIGFNIGLNIPFFFAAASVALGIIVSIYLLSHYAENPIPEEQQEQVSTLIHNVVESFGLIRNSKELRYVVIVSFVTAMCVQPFNMYWAPILSELNGNASWLGFMWALIAVFSSIGLYISSRYKVVTKKHVTIWIMAIAIPMIPAGYGPYFSVVLSSMLLHEIGRGALRPVLGTYSNQHISDNIRSTASSLLGSIGIAGNLVGLQIFGVLTLYFAPTTVWSIAAIMLFVFGILVIRNGVNKNSLGDNVDRNAQGSQIIHS